MSGEANKLYRLNGRLAFAVGAFDDFDGFEVLFDQIAEKFGLSILEKDDGIWHRRWKLDVEGERIDLTYYDREIEFVSLSPAADDVVARIAAASEAFMA